MSAKTEFLRKGNDYHGENAAYQHEMDTPDPIAACVNVLQQQSNPQMPRAVLLQGVEQMFPGSGMGEEACQIVAKLADNIGQLSLAAPKPVRPMIVPATLQFFLGPDDVSSEDDEEEYQSLSPLPLMNQELDFRNITVSLHRNFHGFTSWAFLMSIASTSFNEMLQDTSGDSVEISTIKRQTLGIVQIFLTNGYLDAQKLSYLCKKCHDGDRWNKFQVEETQKLGSQAPLYDVGEGYPYQSRQVYLSSKFQPKMSEIVRFFMRNFQKGDFFHSEVMPSEGYCTLQSFCEERNVACGAKTIFFTRPDGWHPTSTSRVFPNAKIFISGQTYTLKGVMITNEWGNEIFYETFLFDRGRILSYSSRGSAANSTWIECVDSIYTPEEVEQTLGYFFRGDSEEFVSIKLDLDIFVQRLMQNSDLFLYERCFFMKDMKE